MLSDDGQLLRSYDRLVVKPTMARSPATTTAAQLTAMGICREPMLTGQPYYKRAACTSATMVKTRAAITAY